FARFANAVEYRETFVRRPALAGRHTAHDLRSVVAALNRVERSLAAGDALHDDSSVLVCPDGHQRFPCAAADPSLRSGRSCRFAAATTFCAASYMPSAVISGSPELLRISLPRSTFVPSRRTTTGTGSPMSRDALTTPLAIRSQRS